MSFCAINNKRKWNLPGIPRASMHMLEGSTCSRPGNCTSIHNPNGSPHDFWRSAHERGSNSVCQIYGFIREKYSSTRITPPVLSLGQLCEDQRYSCEWNWWSKRQDNSGRKFHRIRRTSAGGWPPRRLSSSDCGFSILFPHLKPPQPFFSRVVSPLQCSCQLLVAPL